MILSMDAHEVFELAAWSSASSLSIRSFSMGTKISCLNGLNRLFLPCLVRNQLISLALSLAGRHFVERLTQCATASLYDSVQNQPQGLYPRVAGLQKDRLLQDWRPLEFTRGPGDVSLLKYPECDVGDSQLFG